MPSLWTLLRSAWTVVASDCSRPLLPISVPFAGFRFVLFYMAPKGGVRKRLASAVADDDLHEPVVGPDPSAGSSSEAPRLRGSVRRRLSDFGKSDDGGSTEVAAPRPLTASLKKKWATGKLTSPDVQEIAQGAMLQGATGVDHLAAAGSHGKHAQNMQRSLIAAFGLPKGAPYFSGTRSARKRARSFIHSFCHICFSNLCMRITRASGKVRSRTRWYDQRFLGRNE